VIVRCRAPWNHATDHYHRKSHSREHPILCIGQVYICLEIRIKDKIQAEPDALVRNIHRAENEEKNYLNCPDPFLPVPNKEIFICQSGSLGREK
jgi:hypothetical protein